MAGIKGIQVKFKSNIMYLILDWFKYILFILIKGVIRKTVSDDLVENIWEPVHMDKIVPSLLFNMHTMK